MNREEASFDHHGRPVLVQWQSTPQLYVAIFEQEYDGAIDSRCPMGFGREMSEAVADLIEQDEDHCASCGKLARKEIVECCGNPACPGNYR